MKRQSRKPRLILIPCNKSAGLTSLPDTSDDETTP